MKFNFLAKEFDFLENGFRESMDGYIAPDTWAVIVLYILILSFGIVANSMVIIVFAITLKVIKTLPHPHNEYLNFS